MSLSEQTSLSDQDCHALYRMAYQLYRNGKYLEAQHFFHYLTHAEPYMRRNWMGLAAAYQMQKDYSAAIECYSVAALQDPDDPYAHWHAAECFFAQKQYCESLKVLDSAITVAKQNDQHQALLNQLKLIQLAWKELRET